MTLRTTGSLALALALAACASLAPDNVSAACARGKPGPIEGEWMLERIDGVPWIVTPASLLAAPTGFAGELACNGYGTAEPADGGAHYALAHGRLVLEGDMVTTSTFCGDRTLMAFEAAFVQVLASEPHVARKDEMLCFYTDDGRSLEFRSTAPVRSEG